MDATALALATSLALAPDAAKPAAEPQDSFHLEFALDAWIPRLEGDFTDAGAKVDVRDADLHDMEFAPGGTVGVRRDRLFAGLRGFSFSTEGGGVADEAFTLGGATIAAGDEFTSDFSWWSAGAVAEYEFYRPYAERPTPWSDAREGWTPAANGADLAILALFSCDVQGLSRDLADLSSGARASADETFVTVQAGLGFRFAFDTKESFPIVRRVTLGAKAAYGASIPTGDGDPEGAFRVEAEIAAWFCDEGAAYFGYRYTGGDYDGDDMRLEGSLQGLRAGIRVEF